MITLNDGLWAILWVVFMFVVMSWAIAINFYLINLVLKNAINFYLIKLVLKKLNALPDDFPSFIFEKSSNRNTKHKSSKEKDREL